MPETGRSAMDTTPTEGSRPKPSEGKRHRAKTVRGQVTSPERFWLLGLGSNQQPSG